MPDRTPYVSVAEAARALRVHPQTVYRMVHSGQLPSVRIGRIFRIPRAALEQLVIKSA